MAFVWCLASRQILSHTHMSPWLQNVSSLLQHASIITDNRLCCLRCKTIGVEQPMPAVGGTHSSPTWLYTSYTQHARFGSKTSKLTQSGYATKVIGEHSHPHIHPPGQTSVLHLGVGGLG